MQTQSHTQKLASERVVVAAPMSLAGSAGRIWKITETSNAPVARLLSRGLALLLIVCVWCVVLAWYAFFGLLLVPYRLTRRGSRNRKRQALQHRELLATVGAASQSQAPAPTRQLVP